MFCPPVYPSVLSPSCPAALQKRILWGMSANKQLNKAPMSIYEDTECDKIKVSVKPKEEKVHDAEKENIDPRTGRCTTEVPPKKRKLDSDSTPDKTVAFQSSRPPYSINVPLPANSYKCSKSNTKPKLLGYR